MIEEEMTCNECGAENCEELVTREGYVVSYYIEWLCHKCYETLEGVEWNAKKKIN
jgi:hypothetical protein